MMNNSVPRVPAANWVTVHFAYPTRIFPGRAIQLVQWGLNRKFPRFVHVCFELSNGVRFDRCNGQTLISEQPPQFENGVVILAPSRFTNEEIAARAVDYLLTHGDRYWDCSRFVAYCLGVPSNVYDYPSDLFEYLAPKYHDLLRTVALSRHLSASPTQAASGKRFDHTRHSRRDV